MNIIFMGTPDFALPSLQGLLSSEHKISAVFTAPPKPKNRGLEIIKSPIHKLAELYNINVYTPISLKSKETQDLIASLQADIIIVVAYGFIVPKAILAAKHYGCLNIHPSSLPKYRGAAPLQRTIISDEQTSAVCVMQMDEGLDTGDIILQEKFTLPVDITLEQLSEFCANIGAKLLLQTLAAIDTLPRTPQNNEGLVYANKLTKEEGKINWHWQARMIDCQVRGMSPWPGVFFQYQNKIFKVTEATAKQISHDLQPGTVIDNNLLIACGKDALQIKKIQQAGKNILSAAEFLRGTSITAGVMLN